MRKLKEENQIPKAYAWADQYHKATGAVRRHSGEPYIVHPKGVAEIAIAYGGTEDEIAACLLHDTLEDTDLTPEEMEKEFGPDVAQIVQEVTNEPGEVKRLGKETYINQELVSLSKPALFVKLCDMYYNTLDYPTESQKSRMVRNINYLLDHNPDIEEKCLDLCSAILAA